MRIYVLVFAMFLTFGGLAGGAVAAEEPMADAGLDQTVANGTAVQLDGSGSIHPDGEIDSYGWTVVDDGGETFVPECRNCERTQFVPPRPGQYEITLRVTGKSGATALDTLYLNVTDAGPEAHIDGPDRGLTDESVVFRVDAESPDVTLDRISWAVNDRTIDERSLDGSGDQSEIRLAFPHADTYRIQAAVFDSNGRSTYAAQYVRIDPPDGSDPPDRSGSQILSERTSDVRITFSTDGFYRTPNAGAMAADSSYIGTETDAVDIDAGENAPWDRSPIDGLWEAASAAEGAVSGQERETLECEITGIVDSCRQAAMQAERDGRTEAVRSPDQSGAFDRYGLEGVERIGGPDPTQLAGDTEATVVFVVQQGTEGTLDVVSETKEEAIDSAAGGISDLTEITDSATSTLLPDSTDEESGDSVDGIEKLDETSSIFKRDSARGGEPDTTGTTSTGDADSFTGSASSTIVGETTSAGGSTSGSHSGSRRGSSSEGSSQSSTRSSGSSGSSDTSISSAAASTLQRSSSGGGDGSMNEARTGL